MMKRIEQCSNANEVPRHIHCIHRRPTASDRTPTCTLCSNECLGVRVLIRHYNLYGKTLLPEPAAEPDIRPRGAGTEIHYHRTVCVPDKLFQNGLNQVLDAHLSRVRAETRSNTISEQRRKPGEVMKFKQVQTWNSHRKNGSHVFVSRLVFTSGRLLIHTQPTRILHLLIRC